MKKITILLLFLSSFSFAQVGIGNSNPKSTLDITATNPTGTTTNVDGITIPTVTRQRAQSMTPTNIPVSTMIYINEVITGTAAGRTVNVTSAGFYFWDGSLWNKLSTGANADWSLTGNAGTNPTTNYIGTTDAVDLVLKTANTERLRINNAIGSTTGTAGDISIGDANSGTIKSNKELVLRQDGDDFGSSVLRLRNRNNENGAIFENLNPLSGANLVDFIFRTGTTGTPITSNIKFETRTNITRVTGNTTEWQFGQPDTTNGGPTLVVGANGTSGTGSNSAFLIGNVGIGTNDPKAKFHNAGTTAFTTATSGTNNTILLLNGGTFATPLATANSGVVYIIRNTSSTGNVTVTNIIDYNKQPLQANNLTISPTTGSMMIVSNGTYWYRIN